MGRGRETGVDDEAERLVEGAFSGPMVGSDDDDTDENADGQQEMFRSKLEEVATMLLGTTRSTKYEVKVVVSVKPLRDNAIASVIGVVKGKCAAEYVEEVIIQAVSGTPFKEELRGKVGQPSGRLLKDLQKHEEEQKVQ